MQGVRDRSGRWAYGPVLLRAVEVLTVVLAVTVGAVRADVRQFTVHDHQDTAYLPLGLYPVKSVQDGEERARIFHRAGLFIGPEEPGGPVMIDVGNSSKYSDLPATFARHPLDLKSYIDEDPVHLTVTDLNVYDDLDAGLRGVVSGAYARDSAWLIRFLPEEERAPDRVLLGTGADTAGDGIWQPDMYVLRAVDYDLDRRTEALIYLSTVREVGPRALYCVELETMQLEWMLPVASELEPWRFKNFWVCPDSTEPRVLFVTHAPLQGRTDANYDDNLKYFSVVDGTGELVSNRVIADKPLMTDLIRHPHMEQFWLAHVSLSDTSDGIGGGHSVQISRVDKDGSVVATVAIDTTLKGMYFAPFDHPSSPCLFVHDVSGVLRVYDTTMTLLARSDPCRIGTFVMSIRIEYYDSVLVFSDGLYTVDFERIAAGSLNPGATWPFAYDSAGNVEMLLTTHTGSETVYRVVSKPWWALLDTLYVRNKVYILMVLSALVVGLVLVNYYRHRTRRNLHTISRQKSELERVYGELKEAQAQLIAQEKFKQARDIAGGFAHEIRNALFPAQSALEKLRQLAANDSMDAGRLVRLTQFSDEAIGRALAMTRMITDYSKLEQLKRAEPTSLADTVTTVISRYRDRIEAQGVVMEVSGAEDTAVAISREHLEMILTNLVLNALDALTETDTGRIFVDWTVHDGQASVVLADNGSGIAPEHTERIFDMFYSTRPNSGTGLGLTISRRIAQLYDGDLRLMSTGAQGTSFELQLNKSIDG